VKAEDLNMKRRLPIVIILTVLVAAGVYFYPRWKNDHAPVTKLRFSGNIEAHESQLSFKVQGRIVQLPIEEGQWVQPGALVARLDTDDLRQRVNVDRANLGVRESSLALTKAGTRHQEVQAAQQAMLQAQADLDQRKLDFARAQQLFAKDAISAQDRDIADTNLKRSQAAFQQAKERYDQAVEGSRKEEIAVAEANVKQARESLGLSRITLDNATLLAPTAGVITVRQAEIGEVVSPGTPVATLADLDHLWLRAYVPETDLGKIRWGQAATIRTDTYPSKTYKGRISFISPQAEFTPKSVQTFQERVTLVYRIKIDVENPNHELKPGMPADAEVDLNSNTGAGVQ
jgi:HlyD family secretion protein